MWRPLLSILGVLLIVSGVMLVPPFSRAALAILDGNVLLLMKILGGMVFLGGMACLIYGVIFGPTSGKEWWCLIVGILAIIVALSMVFAFGSVFEVMRELYVGIILASLLITGISQFVITK